MRIGLAAAALLIATLVPSAVAAPADSPGVLRAKLADAIALEQKAVASLAKEPPRWRTADLALKQSEELLTDILDAPGLPAKAKDWLRIARNYDFDAQQAVEPEGASRITQWALEQKRLAVELLREPVSGPQCADRKDNDGDGLVDARYDGGCTSAKDGTEGSPLSCTLGMTQSGLNGTITGTCSGAFGRIELNGPFDTSFAPAANFAVGCRYASDSKLECQMKDGIANPRHTIRARFKLESVSVSSLRVVVKDFARRGRAQTVRASGGGSTTVDPVSARCAARFDFATSRLTVRCDGVDVKSSSAATGGPIVSSVSPADSASAGLARRCEPTFVSGSGVTAAKCYWNAGNRRKPLSFQFVHERQLGAVTIHVLAGGSGEGGTTIVLRQTWRPLAGFECQQSTPAASACATP